MDGFYPPGMYLTSPYMSLLNESQLEVPEEKAVDAGADSETTNQNLNTFCLILGYSGREETHEHN